MSTGVSQEADLGRTPGWADSEKSIWDWVADPDSVIGVML